MKIISILALAFIVPLTLLGEPSSHGHPLRMRLNAVQITFGNQFHLNYPWTLDEFLPLAVGSELLNSQTFDDYTVYPSPVRSNTPVVSASLVAGLNRYEEDHNANLRIGLRYHAGSSRSFQPNHKVSTRTDTLYNAQGSYFGTIDSNISNSYLLTYGSNQLLLDLSLVFSTNTRHRVTLYGGFGIAAGISMRSWTVIEHRIYIYNNLETMQDNIHSTHHLYVADHLQREEVKAPRNAGAAVYLPAGLSVQPWRKDGSANKMHLFYEVQPGIHLTRIKGHSSYFSSGIEQRVGVKFSR